jgi:hypothetical protein
MDLFDIWNDDISRFQDLNAVFIYHLQVKDAKNDEVQHPDHSGIIILRQNYSK